MVYKKMIIERENSSPAMFSEGMMNAAGFFRKAFMKSPLKRLLTGRYQKYTIKSLTLKGFINIICKGRCLSLHHDRNPQNPAIIIGYK
jgi:hypothetical protein